jgi:heme-degrading monooxygenase HmoA
MIFSRWQKPESFQEFIRGDAFANTVAWGKAEILRGKPQHKIYLES